jgi:hypothetical protein
MSLYEGDELEQCVKVFLPVISGKPSQFFIGIADGRHGRCRKVTDSSKERAIG